MISAAAIHRALRSTETTAQICDRVEGKVTQKLEFTSPTTLTIRFVYDRGDDQKA
jgi:hypothetical protein